MTMPRPTLAQLAHHAAAQIGFTVRRWCIRIKRIANHLK